MKEKTLLETLVRIRREIHKNPELGNAEFKTARFIEKILGSLKIRSKRVAKTGILGVIEGGAPGRCIALRADMDALPLSEDKKRSYASRRPGVMHACGHDAHVAMVLGAAMLLKEEPPARGAVKLFFQPNEEGAGGARSLLRAGVMKKPAVNAVIGLHVNPRLPTGVIGLKSGPLMAAVDKFEITILGEGGHAAYPHEGKDAVVIACQAVAALQTIASRSIDPLDPFVLTVGTIQAGARFNILAGRAALTGTVRTLSGHAHAAVPALIRRTLDGVCRAHGARFHLKYERIGSVLSNSPDFIRLSAGVAAELFGAGRVRHLQEASMGGEDFAEYLKSAPGAFLYVGTGSRSLRTDRPWHHPDFDLDESALPSGARLLAGVARRFLSLDGRSEKL